MLSRGVVLCSIFALATTAQGGVQVQLVPTPNLPEYAPNAEVLVDVKLSQSAGGSDQLLRMVEFDLQDTNLSLLTVELPTTHDRGTVAPGQEGDDIKFWSFSSLNSCATSPPVCSNNYFVDDDLPPGTVDTRPNVLSIAYYGLAVDTPNLYQILLPASGAAVTVGKLKVKMPPTGGSTVTLNLIASSWTNANDVNGNRGARVDFGFDPHIIWRPRTAAPNNVTGGTLAFVVCPDDPCTNGGCPGGQATLTTSTPATQKSWWRTTRNIARLTFGAAIVAPPAGAVKIQELLDGGLFGADLSGTFNFAVEPGNILRVRDNAATLQHRKWYAVRNTGDWPCVANFEVQYVLQMGDGTNDGRVLFSDLGFINSVVPRDPAPDDDRHDITSDLRVLFTDMGAANARIPSDIVPKPTGH